MPDTTRSKARATGSSSVDGIEQRLIAFAEQVGRMAGSVHATTDGLMDRRALSEQLTRIRDGASDLLKRVSRASSSRLSRARTPGKGAKAGSGAKLAGRSGGKVDAPGKKHRKAPAVVRGVKHSDETIAKVMGARQKRQRGA